MLQHAFKEWAVICRALAEGKQAIILRKGGVAEPHGEFELEHRRFWLFPTYAHQQQTGIQPEAQPLLARVEADRPPADAVTLAHFAEVAAVYKVHDLPAALVLGGLHVWSEDTVAKRFAYRSPGLYVLAVRVWRVPVPIEVSVTAEYAGCKSWVDLDTPLPTDGAAPVLDDAAFNEVLATLDTLLNPTAFA